MRVYAYEKAHSLQDFQITEITTAKPELNPSDVLVRIKAFSFNPVDYKVRNSRSAEKGKPVILGWDAAGTIEAVGCDVYGFQIGDDVYYAGDLNRDGSYSEQQAVDYRLIAKKPSSLSFEKAAALPLTTLTAWEALFEKGISYTADTRVLIIGGAGGVGSMAIQLLKAKTPARVIATASRPETVDWCRKMGADLVIGRNIETELSQAGIDTVDVIFSTTHSGDYLEQIPQLLKPFGHLCLTDDPRSLDILPFKRKALSVHWEFMFAKSMFNYQMESQGEILSELSQLVEDKKVHSTLHTCLESSIEQLRHAHTLLESGKSIGKIVMKLQ